MPTPALHNPGGWCWPGHVQEHPKGLTAPGRPAGQQTELGALHWASATWPLGTVPRKILKHHPCQRGWEGGELPTAYLCWTGNTGKHWAELWGGEKPCSGGSLGPSSPVTLWGTPVLSHTHLRTGSGAAVQELLMSQRAEPHLGLWGLISLIINEPSAPAELHLGAARLCPVAQMCDLPRLMKVPPRGTGDSVGTSCPAPIEPLSLWLYTAHVPTPCPLGGGRASPCSVPHPTQVFSRHIYFCTHLYTQFPGQLCPRSQCWLCSVVRPPPDFLGYQGQARAPHTPTQPRSVYLGEKSPAAPKAGLCTIPLPQFPPRTQVGADPHHQGPHPPTRVNFGAPDAEAAPGWSLLGGSSITLTPARGGCQAPVPSPAAPQVVLGGSDGE